MARDEFNFHFDLTEIDDFLEDLDDIERDIDRIMQEEYQDHLNFVEYGTKKLVHLDEGELTESIRAERATMVDGIIDAGVGTNKEYAWRRHEEPYRMGTYHKYDNGARFDNYYVDGRGVGTRMKPIWRGQIPGRKYMQRAIYATMPEYNRMLENIMDRIGREWDD